MKKLLLIGIALMITMPAFAWNDNYDDNGNEKSYYEHEERQREADAWNDNYDDNDNGNEESYYEQEERQREAERNKEYPYESNTGTRYKYDLSKPGDRIKYEVDPGAQINDSINPNVEIDRELGQYGGGAE